MSEQRDEYFNKMFAKFSATNGSESYLDKDGVRKSLLKINGLFYNADSQEDKSCMQITAEQYEQVWGFIDTNKNGKIEHDEFPNIGTSFSTASLKV